MSRRVIIIAITVLIFIFILRLTPKEAFANKTKSLFETASSSIPTSPGSQTTNKYGQIKDKVAVITDTQYTTRLIPLILHFHAVLGPEWPIVFYTSQSTIDQHLQLAAPIGSAIWRKAVEDKRIQVRTIPSEFNLTSRNGVNLYLSRPWLWEQLAPATHVLIFQADSMICANSHHTIDHFIREGWDWIAATLHHEKHLYNGGLSLRNRSMILSILSDGNNWERETASGEWTMGGEDVWFSKKMDERGAKLPSEKEAVKFACQYERHMEKEKECFGYHKVHKQSPKYLPEIQRWCPEIALAAPGTLEPSS